MNPNQIVENILNKGDPNRLLTALILQMGVSPFCTSIIMGGRVESF